jgi:hypothetical protein
MKDHDSNIEWAILIALFTATVNQKLMLKGETRHQAKLIFNQWDKLGNRMLKLIERHSDEDTLYDVTGVIEDAVHEIRSIVVKSH